MLTEENVINVLIAGTFASILIAFVLVSFIETKFSNILETKISNNNVNHNEEIRIFFKNNL